MADVEVSYRGNVIASMSASGSKTLQTEGKWCDDDITVDYTSPSGLTITYMTCAIKNERASANIGCRRIGYLEFVTDVPDIYPNTTTINNGATSTALGFAIINGYIYMSFNATNVEVWHNGSVLTYESSIIGSTLAVKIPIPVNFDNTIPFVIKDV